MYICPSQIKYAQKTSYSEGEKRKKKTQNLKMPFSRQNA
jgi:hypothetical protein